MRLRTLERKVEGRHTLVSIPQSASNCLSPEEAGAAPSPKRDEVAYQAVTVAAILLLLGSLWVF
jgi:hypothetical protein